VVGQLRTDADEAGGEIDTGDLIEMAGQLKRRPTGGAAKIECLAGQFVAHRFDGQMGQRFREVGDAEIVVAVMEFDVFRYQPVGFVVRCRLGGHRIGDDIAETGVLEEVPAEGVARHRRCFVATGNPRATLEQVVALVECGRREIVVDRMDFEAGKRINRRFQPLPDIADDIKEGAVREAIDRTARCCLAQPDICRHLARQVGNPGELA